MGTYLRTYTYIHRRITSALSYIYIAKRGAISRDLAVDSGNKHACHMKWKAELYVYYACREV